MSKLRKMRHFVDVFQPVDTITAKGDDDITYPDDPSFQIWCSIEPLAGRELLFARQLRADVTHKIGMRYSSNINHRTKLRWWDGRLAQDGVTKVYRWFNIGPAVNDELRNRDGSYYGIEIQ